MTVEDERAVKDLWVINSMASPRPTLETYKYQMPGEKEAPVQHLFLFDMNDNSYKEICTSAFKDQTLRLARKPWRQKDRDRKEVASVWLGDNNRFFVTRSSRDLHRIDICSYTVGQDSICPIIEERMNTYQEVRPLAAVGDGKELIQWSERDGWAHLYLYDGEGNLKNRITRGPWHVDQIVKVDEAKRVVYFLANGKEKDENPYYEHLYRVGLDGSGLQQVTPGDYFHTVSMDDNAAFVVNNYSRVNTIPRTDLMDSNGRKLMTLEESDFSGLLAAGYQFPEPFKVKAADGVTDLYGVMYKPFNFDSTALYPIIDYVYPGPQVEATVYPFSRMSVRTDRLAQAGFIVITVGNRGGHRAVRNGIITSAMATCVIMGWRIRKRLSSNWPTAIHSSTSTVSVSTAIRVEVSCLRLLYCNIPTSSRQPSRVPETMITVSITVGGARRIMA